MVKRFQPRVVVIAQGRRKPTASPRVREYGPMNLAMGQAASGYIYSLLEAWWFS